MDLRVTNLDPKSTVNSDYCRVNDSGKRVNPVITNQIKKNETWLHQV